jgi:hypothetical protein
MSKEKRIKNFEEACAVKGLDPTHLPDVSMIPEEFRQAVIDGYKLMICINVLNGDWAPNWNDQNEPKYQPWFEVKASKNKPGGSGLVYYNANYWFANTYVSSRLCLRSRELAEYAGKTKGIRGLYESSYLIK